VTSWGLADNTDISEDYAYSILKVTPVMVAFRSVGTQITKHTTSSWRRDQRLAAGAQQYLTVISAIRGTACSTLQYSLPYPWRPAAPYSTLCHTRYSLQYLTVLSAILVTACSTSQYSLPYPVQPAVPYSTLCHTRYSLQYLPDYVRRRLDVFKPRQ